MTDPVKLSNLIIDPLIINALKEDITQEDISTNCVIKEKTLAKVDLLAKEEGIIAGLNVFERVFALLEENSRVERFKEDGDKVKKGELVANVYASARTLLSGERVALNFLQRMSGIASYTHKVVKLMQGSRTKVVDTRKTTPGLRALEKYSVRIGGGGNHRFNLSDGVMLKDNHIAAAGGVKEAILRAKSYAPFVRKIEVEVENMDMVKEAVSAGADIIMLDNMSPEEIKEAVEFIDNRAIVELSGNITLENINYYKNLGAHIISSGALTHSAPVLDLSLKNLQLIK